MDNHLLLYQILRKQNVNRLITHSAFEKKKTFIQKQLYSARDLERKKKKSK